MNKELRVDSRFTDGIRDGKQCQVIKRDFDEKYTTVSLMNSGFAIRDEVPVVSLCKITISDSAMTTTNRRDGEIWLSGDYGDGYDLDKFAVKTGFKDWNHLLEYICAVYELPFTGVLVEWEYIK
jgi:hypothetical protein